jgi:hypothetical protein
MECGANQLWQPIADDGSGGRLASWETTDEVLLGTLYKDGSLQIAYRWFIAQKGLLNNGGEGDYGQAPVEDDGAPVQQNL